MAYNISNFKFNSEVAFGAMFEEMANASFLNAGTNNTINVVPAENKGQFKKESFLKDQDFVTRQDYTSVAAADSTYVSFDEAIAPKVYRKFQIDLTPSDLFDMGTSDDEISYLVGQRIAEKKIQNMFNTAIFAADGAISSANNTLAIFDASGLSANTASVVNILGGLKKLGDKATAVEALVMHSSPFYDLVGNNISDKITGISDFVAYGGVPATLGKLSLVSDSSALVAGSIYNILGLVRNAVVLEENAGSTQLFAGMVSGAEKLIFRIQGEFSFNVKVKGFSYSSATANPIDSALATSTNWTLVNSSYKTAAGFKVKVK